jgi:subtilisin family serine protease
MKTGRLLFAAALLPCLPLAASRAQTPRGVSPRFARAVARRDTTVVAWILAHGTTDLDQLAAQVTARGGRVRFISRFARGVSAEVPGGALGALARLPGVVRVQPVASYFRRVRESESPRVGESNSPTLRPSDSQTRLDTLYGPNLWIATQLRLQELHARGLRGAKVRIAMLDAGFNTSHPYMAGARVIAQRDFVNDDSIVRDQPGELPGEMAHGTGTWSLIAARVSGVLYGVAPDADFLLAKTEFTATETRVEEDRWVAAVEWAVGLNAQIISSSLGYLSFDNGFSYAPGQLNGDVGVTTIAADSAAARGVLVVVSAGNEGPNARTIDTPADADSVVAVGATDSLRRIASFSSRGPTSDGRVKPEVAAPGVGVIVADIDSGSVRGSGTSYAAPLIAGLAALVQGTRTGPAIELRDGLMQAADRWLSPDNSFGFGIPDGLKLYAFPRGVRALGPGPGLLNTVTPIFQWDAGTPPSGSGANIYLLRIWSDSTRRNIVMDTVVTTSSLTMARGLVPGTTLYWRVIAGATAGVAESTSLQGPAIVPAWSTMLTLGSPQGATIRDSLPRFVWRSPGASAPPGPFRYDVDVYPASRTPLVAVASARNLSDTTFQPTIPLEKNLPFRWRVVAHLGADSQITTSPGTFLVADASTPVATVLFQNFPNPFPNPATGLTTSCIWFDVAQAGDVRLEIHDLRGRLVRRLAPGPNTPTPLPAGRYGRPAGDAPGTCDPRFAWDGRDDAGQFVRAGVYLYRLTAPGFRDSKRIVFVGPP